MFIISYLRVLEFPLLTFELPSELANGKDRTQREDHVTSLVVVQHSQHKTFVPESYGAVAPYDVIRRCRSSRGAGCLCSTRSEPLDDPLDVAQVRGEALRHAGDAAALEEAQAIREVLPAFSVALVDRRDAERDASAARAALSLLGQEQLFRQEANIPTRAGTEIVHVKERTSETRNSRCFCWWWWW